MIDLTTLYAADLATGSASNPDDPLAAAIAAAQAEAEAADPGPWYYAQIGEGDICTAVTQTAGPITADNVVRIDSLDLTRIGRVYSEGAWSDPAPTDPTRPYIVAVDAHMHAMAQAHGYDSIVSACSYAGAPNAFQGDGIAYLEWRGAVWEACHAVLADVQAGNRPVPTPAELIAELPALVLP